MSSTIWATAKDNKRGRREEWFRRVQWAESLTATNDPQRRAAGSLIMAALARPDLHDDADADKVLIDALNRPAGLDTLELDFSGNVDEIEFVADTEDNIREEQP